MTRAQLKYFGTKRQKAAAKAARKRKRKPTPMAKKRKPAKRKAAAKAPKRRRRMNGPMNTSKITKTLMHGGAAFAGGYLSGYVGAVLPDQSAEIQTAAAAGVGLVLAFMQPTGVLGAAGVGLIGGAGRAAKDGNVFNMNGAPGKGEFRKALRERMNGIQMDRQVITGVSQDRQVITGARSASAYGMNGARSASDYGNVSGEY